MSTSELDRLMGRIREKYNVETVPLTIGDRIMKMLQLNDFEDYIEEFINRENPGPMDLPYWAKVWDASLALAYFIGRQPPLMGQQLLEIGAGMGVVGLYAALCGHQVTISDINEDALLFARANALLNGCPQVQVERLDWNDPTGDRRYDIIMGAEVVYDRETYPALVEFLRASLAPGGMVFLSKNAELAAPRFFVEFTKHFMFKQTTQKCFVDGRQQKVILYAARTKGKRH